MIMFKLYCSLRIIPYISKIRLYHWSPVLTQNEKKKGRLVVSKEVLPKKIESKKPMSIEFGSSYNKLLDKVQNVPGLNKREQFFLAIEEFLGREKYRKGHVQFMTAAMRRMDEFGLNKDLESYNKLIDVFPMGRFRPRRMLEAFWPRESPQMELCLDILTKMEENGVRPDRETYVMINNIFGGTFPLEKCYAIMYFFDKYRDIDPYEIRTKLPTNPVELSRLCLFRMGGEFSRLIHVQLPKDNEDPDFIVSGHSDKQWKRLEALKDRDLSQGVFLHVEGPRRIWLKKLAQYYFTLRIFASEELMKELDKRADDEGLLLGMCMCAPFCEAKLQTWIHNLQKHWPSLAHATIVYKIADPEQQPLGEESKSESDQQNNLLSS